MGVKIDPNINAGHIMQAAVIILAAAGLWFGFDKRLSSVENKISSVDAINVIANDAFNRTVTNKIYIDQLKETQKEIVNSSKEMVNQLSLIRESLAAWRKDTNERIRQ